MSRRKNNSSKSFRTLVILTVIVLAAAALFNCISVRQNPEARQNETAAGIIPEGVEVPLCAAREHKKGHEIRNFNYYSVCYREDYEQAEWSCYSLTRGQLKNRVERTDDFREDPMISTGSATLGDYRRSGFDRGHLTPAADREFSKEAVSETFYMSNMSPQFPAFNREIWQYLEHQVRVWAEKFGTVYVVSGPVLEKSADKYESIGKSRVSIPQYYYKVILSRINGNIEAIGFIISNEKHRDEFWNYAVSVDEVEKRTGIDFFSLLDDVSEDRAEASFDISLWK